MHEKLGYNCFADDTGLVVDALNGEPGVYSARYAGVPKSDDANMNKSLQYWIRKTFFNLLIVSVLGVVLRYKIAFPLTFIDQKYLLHGHSHFAFTGWVSQTIMLLMIYAVSKKMNKQIINQYQGVLWINLITAYGMLISFPIQGYGLVSISFSTLSILNSYVFSIKIWKDINKMEAPLISNLWFKAALLFNFVSSIGAFTLAFLMASNNANQTSYLLSVYGFLHFSYNGWFFFGCMGLLVTELELIKSYIKKLNIIFWLFSIACIPAYLLSALWLKLPVSLYVLVLLAALAQLIGWILLLRIILDKKNSIIKRFSKNVRFIMALSAIALSIKIVLQTLSTIPSLSQISFGFRPIVIGYLHLMLLGVISLFLIAYVASNQMISFNRKFILGLYVFVIGIITNELLLMWQGIKSMNYIGIPNISEYLFVAALIMFSGMLLLNYGIIKEKAEIKNTK